VLDETYSKIRTGIYLSDYFLIQNGLKQGDALSPLLSKFLSEYAIRNVQENQVGLKLNGTHQLLGYSDGDVNVLGDNIRDAINKNIAILILLEVALEANTQLHVAVFSLTCGVETYSKDGIHMF
jgi:hypothetical protein